MRKILCIMMAIVLMSANIQSIQADNLDVSSNTNKDLVDTMLPGFYSSYEDYEITYGDNPLDQKVFYYETTKGWYEQGNYEAILQYNVSNDISIVKNNTSLIGTFSIATRPIDKSVTKTFSVDSAGYFEYGKVTVRFTGTYKYHTGDEEITSVTASPTISYSNSRISSNGNRFTKSYTATVITLTETMNVVITHSAGVTTTYSNSKFVSTINAK